jgi:phosphatidate cytidylyltransferase
MISSSVESYQSWPPSLQGTLAVFSVVRLNGYLFFRALPRCLDAAKWLESGFQIRRKTWEAKSLNAAQHSPCGLHCGREFANLPPMTPGRLTFFLRLSSTLFLWALMLATVFIGWEIGFFALVSFMAMRALWEYYRMLERDGIRVFTLTGLICAAVLLSGGFLITRSSGADNSGDFELLVLVLFLVTIFARQMFRGAENDPLRAMSYTVFGLFYIPWLFSFVTKIIYLTPRLEGGMTTGQWYVLYLVAVTKFSDMGAYVFGSLFGKRPFAPHISPKKTWEGFAGALFSSLLCSFWLYALMPEKLSAFRFDDIVFLGLLLGFAAVVGDLAESIVKRGAHTKDSSAMLPGIGGTLDLIDSILFTAPILFFYMRFVLGVG